MQVLVSQWWVILSNVCSDPYLLLPVPSHFSSTCASYFHPWLGGRVVNTFAHILEFLTKIYVLSLFSSRWIQPKRKGCPTPSSHPKVILACSSPPSPRATSVVAIKSGTPFSPWLPCPFHIGSREEGKVMWEGDVGMYVCGVGIQWRNAPRFLFCVYPQSYCLL